MAGTHVIQLPSYILPRGQVAPSYSRGRSHKTWKFGSFIVEKSTYSCHQRSHKTWKWCFFGNFRKINLTHVIKGPKWVWNFFKECLENPKRKLFIFKIHQINYSSSNIKKQNIIILIVGKVVNESIRQGKSPNIRAERIMMSQVTAALPLTASQCISTSGRLFIFSRTRYIFLKSSENCPKSYMLPRKLRLNFQFQRPASSNNSNTVLRWKTQFCKNKCFLLPGNCLCAENWHRICNL